MNVSHGGSTVAAQRQRAGKCRALRARHLRGVLPLRSDGQPAAPFIHFRATPAHPSTVCINHTPRTSPHFRLEAALHSLGLRGPPDSVSYATSGFCLLGTHMHLICEADGPAMLASGMKSLSGTIAKAINRRLGRKGRVIASRYHLHLLRTKTEVRHAV